VVTGWLKGCWRLAQPLRYTTGQKFWKLPSAYREYWRGRREFQKLGGVASFEELHPIFFDDDPATQSGGGQYFYQDVWALNCLAVLRPDVHHDVGSRLDGFVGQATSVSSVVYWDIRPPRVALPRLEFRRGSIVALPLPDQCLASLSCLHTAEHVGLGRYGDPVDPDGTAKALRELSRVLAPGGQLLFSMPIGRERVCFNAQRIWHPQRPLDIAHDLTLLEFAAITDEGEFVTDREPSELAHSKCACGLYRLTRKPAA
jgi:SAM-dependent methyltransferase